MVTRYPQIFEHITYNVNFSPRKLWADLLKERETTSQAMENTNYIETKKDIEERLCIMRKI